MDTITKKHLVVIRDAAKVILNEKTANLTLYDFWTCNEISDICTELGLTYCIKSDLIYKLGAEFVHSQLNLKIINSAFLNDWCDPDDKCPRYSENIKYWRIVWLNFVINRCDQYLRGDIKLIN